jgi:signal transduction histidine kinase
LQDELNRARFDEHGLGRLGIEARAGIVVPLMFRGRAHGALFALDRRKAGPTFTVDDERLLEAFAVSAGTAVATARTIASDRQRQRLAAAEAERQRWARELHDDTLQSLSALRRSLSFAGRAQGPADVFGNVVRDSVRQIDDVIANLRALITDLRPGALDELGLEAAISALAERSSRYGLDVRVSVDVESGAPKQRRHPGELETAVYRIAQEALTHAGKHGAAQHVVIELIGDETALELSVRDDGTGFDPAADTNGFGLMGMHERAALLDGELRVVSAPGEGTTITARLPVTKSDQRSGTAAVRETT